MSFDDQEVRAVSVTELRRSLSAVIEQVRTGERVIVTKHGLPVAVILSIGDGFEAAVARSEGFARLRCEARRELAAGDVIELPPWRTERE
jgi:prevent-host-death family protein